MTKIVEFDELVSLRDVVIWAFDEVKPCPDKSQYAEFCPSCLYAEIVKIVEEKSNGK
jgi:hypothetical protein